MSAQIANPTAPTETAPESALQALNAILIPEENLQACALQRRPFALLHRRVLVAATSGRLIWITRKLLGGYDVANVRWQDLDEVALHVGILGAQLTIRAGKPADLATEGASGSQTYRLTGLRKASAQAVYRVCQAQVQAWREKRRIRELEELRARSGGIQMLGGAGVETAALGAGGGRPSAVQRLQEAKRLLDERLITDSEYEAIKARILASG